MPQSRAVSHAKVRVLRRRYDKGVEYIANVFKEEGPAGTVEGKHLSVASYFSGHSG